MNQFKRCLVITNPRSISNQRAMQFTDKLHEYFPDDAITLLAIGWRGAVLDSRAVAEAAPTLDQHTLVCIAGGDGTISMVVNRLMQPDVPARARQAVLLPLWGGNANDLAYMINGAPSEAKLVRIMEIGRVVPIFPLRVQLRRGDESETKFAVCYMSFGASAAGAHVLGNPRHRHKAVYRWPGVRLVIETALVVRAGLQTRRFPADIDGRRRKLYDMLFVNGSRIAKVYRTPVSIAARAFYEIRMYSKHPFILSYFAKIAYALTFQRRIIHKQSLTIQQPVWGQLDGEVLEIAAGTHVDVTVAEEGFRVLSTLL